MKIKNRMRVVKGKSGGCYGKSRWIKIRCKEVERYRRYIVGVEPSGLDIMDIIQEATKSDM